MSFSTSPGGLIRPVKKLFVHNGQRTVLNDQRRFKVIVAGRRWGKTQTAATAMLVAARKPKQIIWYVAPTYRMARDIMWRVLKDMVPTQLIYNANETLMKITLLNGSEIALKGADKPDTLRGVALDFVVIDEAQDVNPDTWYLVLRPTLSSTGGKAIIIGTPKSFNWLYDTYILGQRGDNYYDKETKLWRVNPWKSWQMPTITSPFIPPEEIEAAKHDMDEKSFNQEYNAKFETMSGRVYHAFDRAVHIGDYHFNPALPIYIGQDFNIDPMSAAVMQIQPNGAIWIVDEIVLFGSNTQEAADELARRYHRQMAGGKITIYPDPAGQQRGHGRGESDLDILRDAGFKRLKFRRKAPFVSDRINAVNRLWRSADGQIRMKVDRHCKHVITCMEQLIYKPGTRDPDKTMGIEHIGDGIGYFIDLEYPVRKYKAVGMSY